MYDCLTHRITSAGATLFLAGVVVGFGLTSGASATDERAPQEIVFGVVPQQSASRLAKVWVPTLERLAMEIDLPVRFVTAKNIPTFERCLAIGAYHVAYMNPLHYVHFHNISGYQAIAHRKGKRLRGIMVARRDSDIDALADLDGQDLAFPSPAAFGASVLPRAELRNNQIAFTPNYVSSHDSVYRAVASGLMKAGGGVLRTFNTTQAAVRDQLKVFYTTRTYTPHAIAYHHGVPHALAMRIQQGLITLSDHSAELLQLLGIKAFQVAADEDWDDVRQLNIPPSDFDTRKVRRLQCH